MHQELTTPPPIFSELSLEKTRPSCNSQILDGGTVADLAIVVTVICCAVMVVCGLLFLNSEPMQIAQAACDLTSYL